MGEFPRGLYHGSSKAARPDEEPTLEAAILDAYTQGMRAKEEEGRLAPEGEEPITFRYRVEAIFIEGTNPPSDYKVFLSDNGHR